MEGPWSRRGAGSGVGNGGRVVVGGAGGGVGTESKWGSEDGVPMGAGHGVLCTSM